MRISKKIITFLVALSVVLGISGNTITRAVSSDDIKYVDAFIKTYQTKGVGIEDGHGENFIFNKNKKTGKLKYWEKIRAVKNCKFRLKLIIYKYKKTNGKEKIVSHKTKYYKMNPKKDKKFKITIKFNKKETYDKSGYDSSNSKNKYPFKYKGKTYWFKYRKDVKGVQQIKRGDLWLDLP